MIFKKVSIFRMQKVVFFKQYSFVVTWHQHRSLVTQGKQTENEYKTLFLFYSDRYSRKIIIVVGVSLWSVTTLAGSFVPDNVILSILVLLIEITCFLYQSFWLFALLRCLVGVGEASYSCVAPTIIADIYKADMRTAMFALFNIAVPLGR